MTDASFSPSGGALRAPPPSLPLPTNTATTTIPTPTTATTIPSTSTGPPSISSIPRRSSYASVLSGTAVLSSASSSSFSPLNLAYHPPPLTANSRLSRLSAAVDADIMNSPWRSSPGETLPPHSRKYASFPHHDPFALQPGRFTDTVPAFTPSYLRSSRYVARLDAARRAKVAAHRDTTMPSATSIPLSASSSQASLPRITPSHRGMTFDLIEREAPNDDDHLFPLPSRWNAEDKYSGLELTNGGFEVRYTGPVNKHDHEAAAVRADNPMPPQCGIYYFEITVLSKPKEGMIGIGFSSKKASMERLPGWEQESWAYHGDDGKSFFGESQGQGRQYGPTFGANDTVGCGVNFSTGCAFFTKNGVFLGNAFRELRSLKVYPSVGMKKQPPVHITANFGQQPFMFDIDDMVKKEKSMIYSEIALTSTASLQPPLDENALLQELVAQFLAHDGYVDTARAFAEEVAGESRALENGRPSSLQKYEVEEDVEAVNRQKIRAAILDGDIDKALKYTNAYYANVLQTYPQIQFKLRCRKFLEMMRRCSELSATAWKRVRPTNGLSNSAVFDQEMELDDQVNEGDEWEVEGMEIEDSETAAKSKELLTEAVQYGQQLFIDYPPEERGGDRKMLEDIFSLVAYQDARQSVHGHYLDPANRIAVAEELNSAILVSLGKSSSAALERLYQQTEVLVNEISEEGGAGAFINLPSIPAHPASAHVSTTDLQCCCGRNDCAFLLHNHLALEGLEKDLATAAKLGQALLHRHESYMAEAEQDRQRLLLNIENLEREKREVQAENARIIEENRDLLEQLESLNRAVADSDSHAKSLTSRLENTETELRILTMSAARAADLEAQLAHMELEQSRLQERLQSAQEESKSAVQRWKQAECTLRDLHDQVDRIEKETREERERHADLIQRMERRRTVERELDGAAGRLKGAAAAQELGRNRAGANVVSHFVRDILQDNANLQVGIMELRDMLESSNQEVQNLRDQIISHQPLAASNGQEPRPSTTLSQELEAQESRCVSQEYHIHHHYHPPAIPVSAKKDRGPLFRRGSKKRRSMGNAAVLNSFSGPRKPNHRSQSSTSSSSTILSQTSASIPPTASHRWSLQTPLTDSVASSPQSAYRPPSIFDRSERGFEFSQPTSPDSTVFSSPLGSHRCDETDLPPHAKEDDLGYNFLNHRSPGSEPPHKGIVEAIIPEEIESTQHTQTERTESPSMANIFSSPYRSLRRASSHESLFSVAGMDIHVPSRRPSRTNLHDVSSASVPVRIPRRIISSNADLFPTTPVISTSNVTAGPEPALVPNQRPQALLALMAGNSQLSTEQIGSETSHADAGVATPSRKLSLPRRVGGWVRGRWGTAAVSVSIDEDSSSQVRPSSPSSSTTGYVTTARASPFPSLSFRHPGVNQKGPIMGFRPISRAPVSLHAKQLDEELLRESLAE
ncbi:putative Ran-binding protein (RanBP10) [Aspergillus saccharolyticus JOP 1030-1]|uniref:Protein FYV10 n=1 Tax=Aspergillus saccharolyticus JOP 1030-1 TaxID=1450539 RepID=A0A318Z530_9EURO|nr:hypothetical protein BP01DRAFT_418160 [Aspergillus saccharolyticus JOP 1030-1]PYH42206.1 hypothetical protein BP01DRAFT_418160 [Aspergillus saccharolyticus JOP 1030-1]